MKKRNVTMVLVGGILVLVMALGVTAVFAQTDQDPETPPETEKELPFHQWNKHGFGFGERKERVRDHNELIAAELGVNVEDLRSAHAAAFEAAREDGILGFPGHRGFDKDGEFESYLADALAEIGVSIDDLKAAQEAVKDDIIAELVEQGVITEEQRDMMEARQALKGYIDHAALIAQAAASLGIDLPTPDEAPESRMNPRALMEQLEEKGITMQDVMEAMRQAYESAVNDAVSDDVINNDQAELILESDSRGLHSFGGMRGFGGTRRFNDSHGCPGDGGFRGFGPNADFNYENGNPAPTGVNF
jgi:hypothetical protein